MNCNQDKLKSSMWSKPSQPKPAYRSPADLKERPSLRAVAAPLPRRRRAQPSGDGSAARPAPGPHPVLERGCERGARSSRTAGGRVSRYAAVQRSHDQHGRAVDGNARCHAARGNPRVQGGCIAAGDARMSGTCRPDKAGVSRRRHSAGDGSRIVSGFAVDDFCSSDGFACSLCFLLKLLFILLLNYFLPTKNLR